ncbi:MAG: septum formation initiator family protein [Pseudomonadales bacterium]|nr:septum formation initiator family protein [Pseudomonadales bacterium]
MRWLMLGLLVLLAALQLRLWTGKASWAEVWTLEARLQSAEAENALLAEDNAALEAEVRRLKADPRELEGRAREDLGMIRDGETFILVLPPAEPSP